MEHVSTPAPVHRIFIKLTQRRANCVIRNANIHAAVLVPKIVQNVNMFEMANIAFPNARIRNTIRMESAHFAMRHVLDVPAQGIRSDRMGVRRVKRQLLAKE